MQRSYRSARYLDWLKRIRGAIPSVAVTTDIIVGFPGETEEDFEDTLRVTESARFDAAFTFQYSPRPGTVAANFAGSVPKEVVQHRFDRLVEVQERISLERNQESVGRTVEVLIEGRGRKGNLEGRTRRNQLIHAEGDIPPGTFVEATVTRAHPHHLWGTLAVPAAARG
jgi:tRNA-2-methylthio-N6-dimethylallyladenosine synthase